MLIWCLNGIPWFPCLIGGACLIGCLPVPESVLKAFVLGVVGLFRPPAVPGVRGGSSISHGCWFLSLSETFELRVDRHSLEGMRVMTVRMRYVKNRVLGIMSIAGISKTVGRIGQTIGV